MPFAGNWEVPTILCAWGARRSLSTKGKENTCIAHTRRPTPCTGSEEREWGWRVLAQGWERGGLGSRTVLAAGSGRMCPWMAQGG